VENFLNMHFWKIYELTDIYPHKEEGEEVLGSHLKPGDGGGISAGRLGEFCVSSL
jgi:hypothetical protein